MTVRVPVSWGELLDKLTILEIKAEKLSDPAKRRNVEAERAALAAERDSQGPLPAAAAPVIAALRAVNERLWEIEDEIRDHERRGDFGETFIALARAVYHTNDRRAALKRQLNEVMGSDLVEEKSYAPY